LITFSTTSRVLSPSIESRLDSTKCIRNSIETPRGTCHGSCPLGRTSDSPDERSVGFPPRNVKFKLSRRPERFFGSIAWIGLPVLERARVPRAGHVVVLSLASASDRQVQLSLGWRRHSIRPEKPRYYSQEGSTQEVGT
jgi:hypothetical protein